MSGKLAQRVRRNGEHMRNAWRDSPGGWPRVLVAGMLVYLLAFVVWQLAIAGRVEWAGTFYSLSPIFTDVALILILLAVVRKARIDRVTRRAWLWILLASVATLIGNITWSWYDLVLRQNPFPSWADAAYLSFFPLMMVGLLTFPVARRNPADRVTLWLDTGVVLIASWMAVWYFVLGPTIAERDPEFLPTMLAAAYPLGDVLLLYAVVRILMRGSTFGITPSIRLIVPSVLVLIVGDLGFAYLSLNDMYATGHWIDLAWMLSPVLLALAGYLQLGQRGQAPDAEGGTASTVRLGSSLLTYGAMALGYGLLLIGSLQGDAIRLNGLVIGAIVLSGLIITRQVLAFQDNHRLLDQSMELSQRLQESESRFRSLVQHGSDIILLLDGSYRIRYISPSVLRVTGVPPEMLIDQVLLEKLHPDDQVAALTFLDSGVSSPGFMGQLEVRILHAEGSWLDVEAFCSNQLHNPMVEGIVINARDITDRKMLEARLVAQANRNPLTNLPNRKHFMTLLEQALLPGDDGQPGRMAILFLDLDGFKQVNDRLGHACGDELLQTMATRLHEWAGAGVTPARLGGDEFTVLLDPIHNDSHVQRLARDLQDILDRPYLIAGNVINMSPSIGIGYGVPGYDQADDVLKRADTAMYQAKAQRRPLRRRDD